jgi:hypothetical protein
VIDGRVAVVRSRTEILGMITVVPAWLSEGAGVVSSKLPIAVERLARFYGLNLPRDHVRVQVHQLTRPRLCNAQNKAGAIYYALKEILPLAWQNTNIVQDWLGGRETQCAV